MGFLIHGLGMPKLGMGCLIHGFAQHGQHHLEHSLQHFLLYLQRWAAEGRPLCTQMFNAAKNCLNDADHAVQNHVLNIPCPIFACPTHVIKIQCIKHLIILLLLLYIV